MRRVLLALLAIGIGYIVYDALSQPSAQDLKGGFKEVAFYRNENNTGPITRIYVVTVQDTLWSEMKKYGDLMPYTEYGNTKVYFFPNNRPTPDRVVPGNPNFDQRYNPYCLGSYEKDAMSQVFFKRKPVL